MVTSSLLMIIHRITNNNQDYLLNCPLCKNEFFDNRRLIGDGKVVKQIDYDYQKIDKLIVKCKHCHFSITYINEIKNERHLTDVEILNIKELINE